MRNALLHMINGTIKSTLSLHLTYAFSGHQVLVISKGMCIQVAFSNNCVFAVVHERTKHTTVGIK